MSWLRRWLGQPVPATDRGPQGTRRVLRWLEEGVFPSKRGYRLMQPVAGTLNPLAQACGTSVLKRVHPIDQG